MGSTLNEVKNKLGFLPPALEMDKVKVDIVKPLSARIKVGRRGLGQDHFV